MALLRGEQKTLADTWEQLEISLTQCLADLEAAGFLIVEYEAANYYVQFAKQREHGIRAEAAGNAYVEPSAMLTVEDFKRMRGLGWSGATHSAEQEDAPEHPPEGSPNFFLDLPLPVNYAELAKLTVRTLREVYRIGEPRLLGYVAFGAEGLERCYPDLALRQRLRSKFPKPDRSDFVPNRTKTAENDQIDIGWHEGVLFTGHPYRLEAWAQDQVTSVTVFLSTEGYEKLTSDQLAHLLDAERIVWWKPGVERSAYAQQITDFAGQSMWSINMVIGDDERTYADSVPLRPYPATGDA
jgi:hypothetical protein